MLVSRSIFESAFFLNFAGTILTDDLLQEPELIGLLINFKDDIEIYSGGRKIIPLEPAYAKKELKQIAPLHLLWSLLWVTINNCDDYGDCTSTPLPVGAVIGVINMGIAAGANKNLGNELVRYNLLDKTIEPGQTVNGIISIAIESGQPLEIRLME